MLQVRRKVAPGAALMVLLYHSTCVEFSVDARIMELLREKTRPYDVSRVLRDGKKIVVGLAQEKVNITLDRTLQL